MTVERARELCIEAHKGQYRKPKVLTHYEVGELRGNYNVPNRHEEDFPNGDILRWDDLNEVFLYSIPYHTHPIAVADMMATDDEKIVALLHDVLEDTDITTTDFKHNGMPINLINSIEWLTKIQGESYEDYLKNLSCCKIATKVKLADMFHNISDNPSEAQKQKYYKGIKVLLNSL